MEPGTQDINTRATFPFEKHENTKRQWNREEANVGNEEMFPKDTPLTSHGNIYKIINRLGENTLEENKKRSIEKKNEQSSEETT
jgi:hypothetical protein